MRRIIWAQSALDDLAGIRDYIARDSAYYAEKFVDDVFLTVERLEDFPESGRIVPERNNPDFREIIFGSYRVLYKLFDKDVYVVTIIHSRRDFS